MYDNKIRLSPDVLKKADVIATEWGLKNARAAVEAVFRKYSDEYLYGRLCPEQFQGLSCSALTKHPISLSSLPLAHPIVSPTPSQTVPIQPGQPIKNRGIESACEAIDALDELLAV